MTHAEAETLKCAHESRGKACKLWYDGEGFDPAKSYMVYTIKNGSVYSWPGGSHELHSEVVPCAHHQAMLDRLLPEVISA